MAFQPLPAPGFSLDPSNLRNETASLTMKGSWKADYTFTDDSASSTLFTIDRKRMSRHHNMTMVNSPGQPLFEIRKESKFRGFEYTFTNPSSGQQLASTNTGSYGKDTTLEFSNSGNGVPVKLLFRNTAHVNIRAEVIEETTGMLVAKIDRQTWSWGNKWQIEVAPGMDLAVICGLAAVVADIVRTKAARGSSAGASAGAVAVSC